MEEAYLLKLLNRHAIKIPDKDLYPFIKNKVILVTGGGGYIGSEICRKIANYSPRKIIIADFYENNAYMLKQEILQIYGKDCVDVYIMSVCDKFQLEKLFKKELPNVVIHAAAHKHVPLMENVPYEAVKNNVFGTVNVMELSGIYGVENFVFISTDKVVNSASVMGATKRIGEMAVYDFAHKYSKTKFIAVRFGNVIGSFGSVVQLFSEQIKRGSVTVAHPEVDRYFMTVSEASQLVLLSASISDNGGLYMLEMGEPVKIDYIAKKMIELEGKVLGKDVKLCYTGLRPGEKLHEELIFDFETIDNTVYENIYKISEKNFDCELFEIGLEKLRNSIFSNYVEGEKILPIIQRIISR